MNKQQGFTLIEAVIYIALFSLLFGGAVLAAYNVIEGSGRSQARAVLEQEGSFVLAKINWALSGANSIQIPAPGAPAPSLLVSRWISVASTTPLIFDLDNGHLRITGTGTPVILNTSSVLVTSLFFKDIPPSNGQPEGVSASTTLQILTPNGAVISEDFSATNYLHK